MVYTKGQQDGGAKDRAKELIDRDKKAAEVRRQKAANHGAAKTSVRVITAPNKVLGIRNALKQRAVERLQALNLELTPIEETYLDGLVGFRREALDGDEANKFLEFMEAAERDSELVKPVQDAFVFAYQLVPDAQYIEYLPGKKLVQNERPKRKQHQATVQRHKQQRYKHAPTGERRQANHRKDRQPKRVVSPGFHVCEKMKPHLEKLADRHNWSNEVRLAVIAHARALTMGTTSISQTAATLNKLGASRARVSTEKCFAATCLYQHRMVRDAILPGMEKNWYRKYYKSAMEMKQRKESHKDNPAAVVSAA